MSDFTIAANVDMVFGTDDPVAGIERAADLGLEAVEFFDLEGADRSAAREASEAHGVAIAATVATGVAANASDSGPSITDPSLHEESVADLVRSIGLAEEVDAASLVVTVGPERPELPPGAERRAIVDVLRDAADEAERAGIDLVLEPLNHPEDHPGYYLTSSYEGYDIVQAVDSPAVSLLYDVYHQQITEGNLVNNLTDHLEYVGHFHVADVPGRHEPGTGEIDYERVFAAIDDAGYDGYVGLEYRPSTDVDETVRSVQSLVPE